jgi:esterase/lipase
MFFISRRITMHRLGRQKSRCHTASAFGFVIGGIIAAILTDYFHNKMIDTVSRNIQHIDWNSPEETEENLDKIRQSIYSTDYESIGNVGTAMEEAFEDLEDRNAD